MCGEILVFLAASLVKLHYSPQMCGGFRKPLKCVGSCRSSFWLAVGIIFVNRLGSIHKRDSVKVIKRQRSDGHLKNSHSRPPCRLSCAVKTSQLALVLQGIKIAPVLDLLTIQYAKGGDAFCFSILYLSSTVIMRKPNSLTDPKSLLLCFT